MNKIKKIILLIGIIVAGLVCTAQAGAYDIYDKDSPGYDLVVFFDDPIGFIKAILN